MHTRVLVADDRPIDEILCPFLILEDELKNDVARWDYFVVGGRFEGSLPLKEPRRIRRVFGLISVGQTKGASVAKKFEVDEDALLANPPGALFFERALYECPIFGEGEQLKRWDVEFRHLFSKIPANMTLQIVDAHS